MEVEGRSATMALVLPPAQYSILDQTVMPNTTMTLLEHLRDKNRFPGGIFSWHMLEGAGNGDTDRMVIYDRDPDKLQLEIPMEFLQHDPQARNLEFVVPCEERFAGVIIYYPLSICYVDGI